jgi:DNA replication factor GINS
MNLDELQSVQSRERQTDSLQQLRESFYEDAGEYIEQLRAERDQAAERAADPFDSPEVNRLTDDIKTAEQTVEALYERRVGKVVKMASLAAADMPTEEEGLTREERDLFETLLSAIEANRDHVLDVLAGEASPGAVSTPTDAPQPNARADDDAAATESGPAAESSGVGAADVMGATGSDSASDVPPDVPPDQPPAGHDAAAGDVDSSGEESVGTEDDSAGDGADVDRRTVRITDDVGAILGVDEREYDLSTDDVVTLPAANADPLVERDAAEPLE